MYVNPYERLRAPGAWLKANFHTHAGTGGGTCGSHDLLEVINGYREADYDVLTISNHNLFTFTQNLSEELCLIHGVEYSRDPHMLTIGVEEYFDCSHQEAIHKTVAAGGFVILCHPNWIHREYWPGDLMDSLSGYTGIEVIAPLIYRLSGSGLATDVWDRQLTRGKLIYGFSNDDFHQWRDLGRGYTVLYSASKSYPDIKASIESGCFFASTGVFLDTFSLADNRIHVKAKYPIPTYIHKFTYDFFGPGGERLKTVYGEAAEYTLTGEPYVRVQVTGEDGSMMFLQPVYNADKFQKP